MTRSGLTLRGELDKTRCEEPGCESHGPFLLSPPCHDVSVLAEYEKGELTLVCGECLQPFLTVPVAG
jgi:hypothetical protein